MSDADKAEILAVYQGTLDAFLANDVETMNTFLQYPLAHIGAGKITMVDAYPVQPAALMASKGWHSTKDVEYEVVFASADKAHLVLRNAVRIRKDGSEIERVSGFYALTKTPSGWKIFAMSDITIAVG